MLPMLTKQFILAKRLLVATGAGASERLAARRLKSLVLRFREALLMLIWFFVTAGERRYRYGYSSRSGKRSHVKRSSARTVDIVTKPIGFEGTSSS